MKRLNKILTILLSVSILVFSMLLVISADDSTSLDILVYEKITTTEESCMVVSYGLNVIAQNNDMVIAGITGNELYFSANRFACAMNLSSVEYITITRLPDAVCGALYIGSDGVGADQKIKAADISLMTYEESASGEGSPASFDFTVNGSAYQMTCNIYMLDNINYSPTVSLVSAASLNTQTYRDVKVTGVISAYDPEGDKLTYEIVRYPSNGRLILEDKTTGAYSYTPNTSFTGEDSFIYVARDAYGNYSAAATVSLTVSAQGTSAVYSDLIDDALHCHAIAMTERGLMNGRQIGQNYYFDAEREVSRAEFVVTAMNAIGIKNVPTVGSTDFFDDADIKPEMKGYVALAYSKGYISGTKEDGKVYFKPDETIKLSEAAVIISNMIGYASPKVAPVFADANEIPSWSGKAIESLHTLGILETPDNISGASETVTRGKMAKLLNKTMLVIGK